MNPRSATVTSIGGPCRASSPGFYASMTQPDFFLGYLLGHRVVLCRAGLTNVLYRPTYPV